ncbi:MAG: hypothetical protein EOP45_03485 [Sphingobacteriaceae bacterium]|nr:MAG: hypothetical protein EOP45_03485 [Sphingobacteriaceae bacterium]
MNTEKINAYRLVVDTLNSVNSLKPKFDFSTPERSILDTLSNNLTELSWQVLTDDLVKVTNEIGSKVEDLQLLSTQISQSYDSLKDISNDISKVAIAVSTLVEITSKAISAGLIA